MTKFSLNKRASLFSLDKFSRVETILYELLSRENRHLGEAYFANMAPRLCQYIKADYLFIGRYSKRRKQIDTLAFTHKAELLDNFSYNLNGSPCETVIGKQTCSYPEAVYKLFPEDKALMEKHIEGYIGVPLFDSASNANGILVALYKKPIKRVSKIESFIYLFTPRIGAEIEHQQDKRRLELQNKALRSIHMELEAKNQQLDNIIKELNQAKLKAEESNQLKTAFLANLSHEVRTPMNVILGFSELLRSGNLQDEERDDYINIIHQNGQQLLKIMDSLIDVSKLQTRLTAEEPQLISLNNLLKKIHQSYTAHIQVCQKPIQLYLETGYKRNQDKIYTDESSLQKVLDHLLDNACKFTSSGHIRFGYEVQEKHLLFYVEDTGVGIPKGQEEIIFDLFRQVDLRSTREFGGNGLGLALARKYLNLLGGKIWAETNRNKGARFNFTLPIMQVSRSRSTPSYQNN
jgi:signal transduction histidine kinase